MPGVNPLVIEILTRYLGADQARAAAADLEKVAASTGTAGSEAEKAAEKLKLFSGEGAEMRRVAASLSRVSPELGEAFRAALHPVGGTIAAAIGLFVLLKENIKETNAELDKMGEAAANSDFLEGIESKIKILQDATTAADAYAIKLQDLKRGEHDVATELKDQLALDQAIERARAELVSAQKGLDIAKIQEAENSGKITPVQAEAARAAAEKRSNDQEQAARQASQDQELARKAAALAKAQANAAALEAQQRTDQHAVSVDAARRSGLEKDFGDQDAINKKMAAQQKIIDDATARVNKDPQYRNAQSIQQNYLDKNVAPNMYGGGVLTPDIRKMLEGEVRNMMTVGIDDSTKNSLQQIVQATTDLGNLRAGQAQYNASVSPDALDKQAELKAALEESTKKATENATEIGKLTAEISALNDIIAQTRPIEQQTTATKNTTEDAKAQAAIEKQGEQDVEEINRYAQSKKPSTDATIAAKKAIDDMAAINAEQLNVLLTALHMTKAEWLKELEKVKKSVAQAMDKANNPT